MAAPKQDTPSIPAFGMVQPRAHQVDNSRKEIVFWEEGNPRCVVNLLSEKMRELVMNLPPNYLAMSDKELEQLVEPGPMDEQLRLSFWDEYFIACDNESKMRVEAIYPRVCSREYFYKHFMQDPKRLAYMMRPPQEYMLRMRSILDLGIKRFEEILQLPLYDTRQTKNGPVKVLNTKLIGEIVKITALVDNRVKGAVAQKIQLDTKSVNLNIDYEAPKSHAEIEKELKEVQRELLELGTPREQIEERIAFEGFTDESEVIEVTASSSKEEGT